ncbi:MAG: hypothetical protein HC892_16100, partial [Saprospiraceae bacterium]|nr:hypothetical protein [Saprospiraceae bacterium]
RRHFRLYVYCGRRWIGTWFFVKNVGDYFKGGGTIPWYVGGISNFMTLFSTFVFVAYAGIAYEHGLVALVVIWCAVPATIIGATVFAHRWRRAGIASPVEFMEVRFNASVRQIFSWGGLGFRILDNMVRLYAIGIFVSTATPMNLETSILVAGVIVVFYTVVGGLWAVVLTDVIQFVVLIVATIILVPLSIEAAGGWTNLMTQRPNHFAFFNGPKGEWTFLLVYYLMFAIKNNGNWAFIQRFYSVKDEHAGRKMGLLTAVLFLIFPFFFMIPPIAASFYLSRFGKFRNGLCYHGFELTASRHHGYHVGSYVCSHHVLFGFRIQCDGKRNYKRYLQTLVST